MNITTGIEYDVKFDICKEIGRIEIVKYKKPVKVDLVNNFKNGSCSTDTQYMENKKKTILKSAKKIMQLVEYNAGQYVRNNTMGVYPPVFLTLTFTDNVQDWNYANREFSKFIQRLNYYVYKEKCSKLAYIGVPELQNRGAIHYHVLFFNLPYIDKFVIRDMWGHGERTRIEVEKMKDMQGKNLGKYLVKYMIKQFYSRDKKGKDVFYYDKEKWEGKKIYFCSMNLYRPTTFRLSNEEYLSISELLNGEKFSSDLIFATLKNVDVEETIEIGIVDIYKKVSDNKIENIYSRLLNCKDKYIKSKFVIGRKIEKSISKKMLRLDKICKEGPREKYLRIRESLLLDDKFDNIGKFVEIDLECPF